MPSPARLDPDQPASPAPPPVSATPLAPLSSGAGRHLLVIDWTFFFRNPMDNLDTDDPQFWLYDWVRGESPLLIDLIWHERALGFLQHGLPLPTCQGCEGFWDKFKFAPGTELMLAESNAFAGSLAPGGSGYDSVWVYDAHHDAHPDRGNVHDRWPPWSQDATNWMLRHHDRRSELHLRYPPWRTRWQDTDPGPAIPLDRTLDDGSCPPVTFEAVYLCRSGGWVPSWCDPQFTQLIAAFPGSHFSLDAMSWDRGFDLAVAQRDAVDRAAQFALLRELTEQRRRHQQQGDRAGQNDLHAPDGEKRPDGR